jgi:pimeloyl-ACP methyl ester carboxylesterase
VDDRVPRVCLSRSVETSAQLHFEDWPGHGRAIVHFNLGSSLAPELAADFAPRYRVLSLRARAEAPYQGDAEDLARLLRVFGFERPLLVGDGAGALAPLLVAAWWPVLAGAVLLIAPVREAASGLGPAGRGLRECPLDWEATCALVQCPLRVVEEFGPTQVEELLAAAG